MDDITALYEATKTDVGAYLTVVTVITTFIAIETRKYSLILRSPRLQSKHAEDSFVLTSIR